MTELEEKFSSFYEEVNGFRPYRWQMRLMSSVAAEGSWPDQIVAPTSAGKTAVIEVHVFLNAVAGKYGVPLGLPRRLCLVVNRRALVDSQFLHARDIAKKLAEALQDPDDTDSLRSVATGLLVRQGADEGTADARPLLVDSMHGGADASAPSREWRSHPESPMIICATPDMFGSRLLFRGYGISREARPVEAGLLAYDTVAVVDEAHLNRQLVKTARQIGRIEGLSDEALPGFPQRPLQVVESTATPAEERPADRSVGVAAVDGATDPGLARKVASPKKILLDRDPASTPKDLVDAVFGRCVELAGSTEGPIAAILNTVPAALGVAGKLAERYGEESVVCVVGRMRPFDRRKALTRLLGKDKGRGRKFIVGTQALEVGIDYDCHAMVTQLAPARSIVQRLGRVNRFGDYEKGTLVVVQAPMAEGPYDPAECEACARWISSLPTEGVSSLWIASHAGAMPSQVHRRPVFQRLESWDVEYLSHTSEDLAAEAGVQSPDYARADLDLWLRDDLEDNEHDVFVAVRESLPEDGRAAAEILSRIPPLAGELFPCSVGRLQASLRMILDGQAQETKGNTALERVFSASDGRSFACAAPDAASLSPGDIVVLDASEAKLFSNGTLPSASSGLDLEYAKDVYSEIIIRKSHGTGSIAGPLLMETYVDEFVPEGERALAKKAADRLQEQALAWAADEDREGTTDEVVASWAEHLGQDGLLDMSVLGVMRSAEVLFESGEDGSPVKAWLVCEPAPVDDQISGYEAASFQPVSLEQHCLDVRDCVRRSCGTLGIEGALQDSVAQAGFYHDTGKRDSRFQKLLNRGRPRDPSSEPLAKSTGASNANARNLYRQLGLAGWRHEQLSAAIAYHDLAVVPDRDLVTVLVGTSHGHGRSSFDQCSNLTHDEDLRAPYLDDMRELYEKGVWEYVVSRTDRSLGYWRVAYLEAIVRAADARVSAGEEQ